MSDIKHRISDDNMKQNNFYDKGFRKKMIENPKSIFENIADDVEVKVVKNTKTTFYLVISSGQQSDDLSQLGSLQAAGTNGTLGTVLTLASVGTVTATASTASTAGSAGTLGSQ